jgi:hypothetical protein
MTLTVATRTLVLVMYHVGVVGRVYSEASASGLA